MRRYTEKEDEKAEPDTRRKEDGIWTEGDEAAEREVEFVRADKEEGQN